MIESLLFAVTLSKGELDLEIQKIITPSSLRSLVEKNYELGRRSDTKEDIRNFFNVASKLSQIAFSLPGSKDTLENILFLGGDSLGRSGQDPREFCKKMLDKEYFSAYYIIGSYCYHQEREFDKALEYFAKASRYPHFRRRTIRMLARVNLKTGNAAGAIDALNMLSDETIFRDSGFLAMKIRALRALRNWPEADALQSRLESLDDEYGELPMLKAAQAYRNRDFREAKHQLALARNRPRSNRITLKFLECAINIEEGEFLDLEGTCATAVAVGRSEDAYQLRALKALKQGNWREAETHLEKIKTKSYFDLAAELRMLIMKINDPEVQKDPVILEETKAKRDEGLARSTRAVEDIEK